MPRPPTPALPAGLPGTPTDQATALEHSALAPATLRAYHGALTRLDTWLHQRGLTASDDSIAAHLADRHEHGAAPATCAITLVALACAAKYSGQPNPAGPRSSRVLSGIRRQGASRGRGQAAPVTWEQADTAAALAANDPNQPAGLRDAAIIACASDALLRVSEIAALNHQDITPRDDGAALITIQHSKTDQHAKGTQLYLGPPTYIRIANWTHLAPSTTGALFTRIRRYGNSTSTRLTDRALRDIITTRCRNAGIQGPISGHSLRIGSAVSLATRGAGLVEMQQAGRWRSPQMPAYYARGELASRGVIARLRYNT